MTDVWNSLHMAVPISSRKRITMKRQNGILSAMFDRVWGDGVEVESGKERESESQPRTQSQEAVVIVATFQAHCCNNHSMGWDKGQINKYCPKKFPTSDTFHGRVLL